MDHRSGPTDVDAAASLTWARAVGPMLAASPIVVAGAFVVSAVEGVGWGLGVVLLWLGATMLASRLRRRRSR